MPPRSTMVAGADAFVQHDVNELFNVLTSALENAFKGTAGDGVIQALFEGRQKVGGQPKLHLLV